MKEGQAQEASGNWEEAHRLYSSAARLVKLPTTRLLEARMLARMGRLIDARVVALEIGRLAEQVDELPVIKIARSDAKTLVDDLDSRLPQATLAFEGAPAPLKIDLLVDGSPPQWVTLATFILDPGEHTIVATAEGFHDLREKVVVAERSKTVLKLRALAQPAKPDPLVAIEQKPSELESNAVEHRGAPTPAWATASVVAGGVLLAGGAVAGLMSFQRSAELRNECENNLCPEDRRGDLDGLNRLSWISNIAIGLGAVGVGVGVWQMWPRDGQESATIAVNLGPNQLRLTGTFR